MRKIEKAMCLAIGQKKSWKESNTEVVYKPEVTSDERSCIEYAKVFLFGNHIRCYILQHISYTSSQCTQS
jgi:hypothetical protein